MLNWLLDQKLVDFDAERKNSYEEYGVKIMREQKLRLIWQGIGQTWNLINPGPQNDSNLFTSYAAKFCNRKNQL